MMRRALAWVLSASGAAAAERSLEFGAELLHAPDVMITQGSDTLRFQQGRTETALTVGLGTVAIDYAPVSFDFLGRFVERRESSVSAQGALRHRAGDRLELLGGAGLRIGHDNYRTLWLDEYFLQRFAGLAGYRRTTPRGFSFSGGARWEYRAGSGFAQFGYSRTQDEVAPGYEIDFDGLNRGAETLVTDAATLSFEHIVTRRLRTRVELRGAGTSGRKPRWSAEASARHAIGERWIVRADVGGSLERPDFRARYGGLELEFAATGAVALFAGAHGYRDTGEIENALLFTSAAPALRSRRTELGARHDGERLGWRISLGVARGDFAATNPATDFFQNLYRDRTWRSLRLAGSWKY
ncbi:MAG: hypothetical protein Q8N18_23115 [Opitutaceae bacterium]|nr:hypothetical protein [Opitutaceae bacterium]